MRSGCGQRRLWRRDQSSFVADYDLTIEQGDSSHVVVVEVADDGRERQQGLMCRETVPYGSGMLFVFESAYSLNFWMFNTYEPLDIVYLDDRVTL